MGVITKPAESAEPAARAAELTAVALDLFERRGFAAVTIKSIGEAAGVNPALIYYYFKDKEDLFRASIESAVDQAFEHFKALRERHDDPAEIISDWLDTHVELYQVVRKVVKVSLDYAGAPKALPKVEASIRRFYDEEARILTACVSDGVARGQFRDVDPAATAEQISTFLDGAMVRSNILPEFDLQTAIGQFRRHLWQHLGAGSDPR
jgi:AcrR family transcriptional regulator